MPKIKVTQQQLKDMGANIFEDVNRDFISKGITGDFLIWLMIKKGMTREQILDTCRNPEKEYISYKNRKAEPAKPDPQMAQDYMNASEQVAGWKLPKADYTSAEDMKEAAVQLQISRLILDTAATNAPEDSAAYKNAVLFDGIHDTIKAGYKADIVLSKKEGEYTLKDPESSLRKRYVLEGLSEKSFSDATAILIRRGQTFGVEDKPTQIAKDIENAIFFPRVQGENGTKKLKKGSIMNAREFLIHGSSSEVGKKLYSEKKDLFKTAATEEEKTSIDNQFTQHAKEVEKKQQIKDEREQQWQDFQKKSKDALEKAKKDNKKKLVAAELDALFQTQDQDERERLEERARETRASLPRVKKELPRCHDSYRTLHTGYFAICRPEEEMRDYLAKTIASFILEADGKPFNLDEIHKLAKVTRENLRLDLDSGSEVEAALKNEKSALAFASERLNDMYGVDKDNRKDYQVDMRILKESIDIIMEDDPTHVTPEFRNYANAVAHAASLDPKKAKDVDYMQANLNVINTAIAYQKGRKSVRRNEDKRDRFNSTLDGMKILSDYANAGIMQRIRPAIDRINYVRGFGDGNITDPNAVDLDRCGRTPIRRRFGIKREDIRKKIASENEAEAAKKDMGKKPGKGIIPG